MTHSEAEEFIQAVIGPGDVMDVREVMKKYEGKTLKEALEDFEFNAVVDDISKQPER